MKETYTWEGGYIFAGIYVSCKNIILYIYTLIYTHNIIRNVNKGGNYTNLGESKRGAVRGPIF